MGEDVPGTLIRSMQFSEAEKARLLSGTALEWLNLSAEQFRH